MGVFSSMRWRVLSPHKAFNQYPHTLALSSLPANSQPYIIYAYMNVFIRTFTISTAISHSNGRLIVEGVKDKQKKNHTKSCKPSHAYYHFAELTFPLFILESLIFHSDIIFVFVIWIIWRTYRSNICIWTAIYSTSHP